MITMNTKTESGTSVIHLSVGLPELSIVIPQPDASNRLRKHGGRPPVINEVTGTRRIQQIRRDAPRFAEVLSQRQRLVDQISWLTAAKRDLPRTVILQQVVDDRGIERQPSFLAGVLEDF